MRPFDLRPVADGAESAPRSLLAARLDDLREDIAFALEGAWLRIQDAADWTIDRVEDAGLPRWAPLAATVAAVGVGLYVIQDSGEFPVAVDAVPPAIPVLAPGPAAPGAPAPESTAPSGEATLVETSTFSLALPAGWVETDPPEGSSFAATSADGLADATLWITEAPNLSFERFEQQSLAQLGELGGDARVLNRTEGPTIETTIVELAAGGADADAPYRVILRAAGDYRYYLATSLATGAPAALVGDTELLRGTLRPAVPTGATDNR